MAKRGEMEGSGYSIIVEEWKAAAFTYGPLAFDKGLVCSLSFMSISFATWCIYRRLPVALYLLQ